MLLGSVVVFYCWWDHKKEAGGHGLGCWRRQGCLLELAGVFFRRPHQIQMWWIGGGAAVGGAAIRMWMPSSIRLRTSLVSWANTSKTNGWGF